MAKKTWKEKLNPAAAAEVVVLDKPMMGIPSGARLLISTPLAVKKWVEGIPMGESRSPQEMRASLAAEASADATCPLTTGIFVRIVSEAALADLSEGVPVEAITPFWRIVDPQSPLAKKLSCGPEFIATRRAAEGS